LSEVDSHGADRPLDVVIGQQPSDDLPDRQSFIVLEVVRSASASSALAWSSGRRTVTGLAPSAAAASVLRAKDQP
jgi:hypothetical protein